MIDQESFTRYATEDIDEKFFIPASFLRAENKIYVVRRLNVMSAMGPTCCLVDYIGPIAPSAYLNTTRCVPNWYLV